MDNLRLFQTLYKNGIPKKINLSDTTSDNVPRFITRKWIEVHDPSMSQSNVCDQSDAYTIVKGTITVTEPNMIRNWFLKIMHHSLATFQKLITPLLIMQKIL